MIDSLTKAQRSELMAKVRATGNRSTEGRAEAALLSAGIENWEKHPSILGKPDFYFRELKLALFIDGCQWHACPLHVRYPKTNSEYWSTKLGRNRRRDNRVRRRLRQQGQHVMSVWEHDLRSDLWLKRLRSMLRRLSGVS